MSASLHLPFLLSGHSLTHGMWSQHLLVHGHSEELLAYILFKSNWNARRNKGMELCTVGQTVRYIWKVCGYSVACSSGAHHHSDFRRDQTRSWIIFRDEENVQYRPDSFPDRNVCMNMFNDIERCNGKIEKIC